MHRDIIAVIYLQIYLQMIKEEQCFPTCKVILNCASCSEKHIFWGSRGGVEREGGVIGGGGAEGGGVDV